MALLFLGLGCDPGHGCASLQDSESYGWGEKASLAPAALPRQVVDCPDGLAQCLDGVVEASRLATMALPCKSAERPCGCPWEEVGSCLHECVAEGLEVVIDRRLAPTQLCAPGEASERFWSEAALGGESQPASCDESQLYRCVRGGIVDCDAHRVATRCLRGCFAEGAFIDGDAYGGDASNTTLRREAAFAILCSR